jgi:hypothetical protein
MVSRLRSGVLWLVVGLVVAVMVAAVAGCGASESRSEEAGKKAAAAHREYNAALKEFEEGSSHYNEMLNESYEPAATCKHLREHQLHSRNRILAKEAADFLREEC